MRNEEKNAVALMAIVAGVYLLSLAAHFCGAAK